jgi:hypothetical protein
MRLLLFFLLFSGFSFGQWSSVFNVPNNGLGYADLRSISFSDTQHGSVVGVFYLIPPTIRISTLPMIAVSNGLAALQQILHFTNVSDSTHKKQLQLVERQSAQLQFYLALFQLKTAELLGRQILLPMNLLIPKHGFLI